MNQLERDVIFEHYLDEVVKLKLTSDTTSSWGKLAVEAVRVSTNNVGARMLLLEKAKDQNGCYL